LLTIVIMRKLLTKSRFKLELEFPNKLFFTSKPEFVNVRVEDTSFYKL